MDSFELENVVWSYVEVVCLPLECRLEGIFRSGNQVKKMLLVIVIKNHYQ